MIGFGSKSDNDNSQHGSKYASKQYISSQSNNSKISKTSISKQCSMQQMSQVQGEVNSRKASENQLEIVIDDNSLFIYEFEHYRAFTIYFPHNNFD